MRELEERIEILVSRTTNNTLSVQCNNPTSRTKDILGFFDLWDMNGGFYKKDRLWCCEMPINMEDIILSEQFKLAFSRIGVSIITPDVLLTNEKSEDYYEKD